MEYIRFKTPVTGQDILNRIDVPYQPSGGDIPGMTLNGVVDGRYPVEQALCYIERPPRKDVSVNLQSCLIVTNREVAAGLPGHATLAVEDPRACFIDILNRFDEDAAFHPFSSLVDRDPGIHPGATVHPSATIESGVYIGDGVVVGSGCVIKAGSCIHERATVRENTVMGCDGIALYKAKDGRVLRFPHFGGVIVHSGVEIGASCVIARGVMSATKIGADSVIGNLSNIGHAVDIGAKVWMSVGALIGGNTRIGPGATIGLGVSVKDNISIGDNSSVGMGSVVVRSVKAETSVFGNPAKPMRKLSTGPKR